jgi:hypothetical protein
VSLLHCNLSLINWQYAIAIAVDGTETEDTDEQRWCREWLWMLPLVRGDSGDTAIAAQRTAGSVQCDRPALMQWQRSAWGVDAMA